MARASTRTGLLTRSVSQRTFSRCAHPTWRLGTRVARRGGVALILRSPRRAVCFSFVTGPWLAERAVPAMPSSVPLQPSFPDLGPPGLAYVRLATMC